MKIPIRILFSDVTFSGAITWGDVVDNWEAYAVEWNASGFSVAGQEAPVLDMFGDEGISVKSVVKDLSDPKKLFTEYSRAFTVPASKKNNKLFRHYYNVDITNGLDARELIPAKILMNNVPYKLGHIYVEGVRMSGGQPSHYKIKFVGNLTQLARLIGQDKLSGLDLTAYNLTNHNYQSAFSSNAINDVVFPLSAKSERFLFDSNTASLGIENAKNIAKTTSGISAADYGITEQDIVGAMRVEKLLDSIEAKYGLSFVGALRENYVSDLYMWLNKPDQQRDGVLISAIGTNYTGGGGLDDVVVNTDSIVFTGDNTYDQERYVVRMSATWAGVAATVKLLRDGEVVGQIDTSGDTTQRNVIGQAAGTYTVVAEAASAVTVNVDIDIITQEFAPYESLVAPSGWLDNGTTTVSGTASVGSAGLYNVTDFIPDLTVMEFLSMLFKMFNIVAEIDSDGVITTDHYDYYMSQGDVKDISRYISIDAYDVDRPNLHSSMRFDWADPKTALELGYTKVNGKQYGELNFELVGQNGKRLSGTEYSLNINSQRIPLERLNNLFNQTGTDIVYMLFSDLKGAAQGVSVGFTYLAAVTGGDTLAWNDAAVVSGVSDYILPSNIYSEVNQKPNAAQILLGLYFGEELDEHNPYDSTTGLGLWNAFYRGTTAMIFDEDKRRVRFTAELPQSEILKLKLNDVLKINNGIYNINSYEVNYLTGVTKLDLMLVGRTRLEETTLQTRYVVNNTSDQTLYITYMDATGKIANQSVSAFANAGVSCVGDILSKKYVLTGGGGA